MDDESERSNERCDVQRDVDEYIRTAQPPPKEILDLTFVYEALANPRRRYLIYSLLSNTRWTLSDLATKLVAWEQDIPEEDVAPIDRDDMYVSLYHAHVPKLVELDIIEFENGDEEVITAAANAVQVLAVLEGSGASLDITQESHAQQEFKEK